jgi:hypothetical protein
MKAYVVCLASALALCACRKDPAPTDTKAEAKVPPASTAAAERRARPPVDLGVDVPTEDDFEESVASQITPETDLKKELDQLEKDIGK